MWEEKAKADKERYNIEKEKYTGPWQVPFKRAKKNPNAPKRPMSAFLYYSQEKRSTVKRNNPGMKNTEVSRVLGKMWQDATDEERAPHIQREKVERDKYKACMTLWKKNEEGRVETEKLRRENSSTYQQQSNYYYEMPEPIPFSAVSPPTHDMQQREYSFPGHHSHLFQAYDYHHPDYHHTYDQYHIPHYDSQQSPYPERPRLHQISERQSSEFHRDYAHSNFRHYHDYGRSSFGSHDNYANQDFRPSPYEFNQESNTSNHRNGNVVYHSTYYPTDTVTYENRNVSSTPSSSHLF